MYNDAVCLAIMNQNENMLELETVYGICGE